MTRRHIKSLYVFDIDDTLFRTTARAKLTNSEGKVKYLNSQELKDFKVKNDETICFAEFKDSKKFVNESQPINPIIKKAQDCIKEAAYGSKTILLTARSDLDCKDLFLEYLNSSGLDTNHIYVERAGNLPKLKTAEAKKLIISKYLESRQYQAAYLFDDSIDNIQSFVQLKKVFPKIRIIPKHVDDTMINENKFLN